MVFDVEQYWEDKTRRINVVWKGIQERYPELESLWEKVNNDWTEEDHIYRFYHYSFKVYWLQDVTLDIYKLLYEIAPNGDLDPFFMQIVLNGTNRVFEIGHNKRWMEETRPIMEAFWHAKYFLQQAVKYGREFDEVPRSLPSGVAALLELYNVR